MPIEHQLHRDTGLDLLTVVAGIWRQRWLVLIVSAISVLAGVAYAMLVSPVYEASVYLDRPSVASIAPLNLGRGDNVVLPRLTTKDVYAAFLASIQSEQLRRHFFSNNYLPRLSEGEQSKRRDVLYAQFLARFEILHQSGGEGRVRMTVRAGAPQQAVEWLSEYLSDAQDQARASLLSDARSGVVAMSATLMRRIKEGRDNARQGREDEIARLNEALKVAESVGLREPPIISTGLSAEVSSGMTGTLSYLRGAIALKAELENLRNRVSDDPYVPNLRQMEASLAFYQGLSVDAQSFDVYRQDGVIEEPLQPLKPNKPFIVTASLLAGFFLGVSIALVRLLSRAYEENLRLKL